MVNLKNERLGKVRSSIRELFEYGKKRKAEIGEDNVFDFSLGNPSVPAPPEVNAALTEIINTCAPVLLHGYTSAQGDYSVRKTLADYINNRFSTSLTADCLYLTCGAAASLTISLNALLNDGDEVIAFAPFFPEYRIFTEHAGGKLVTVKCRENDFKIDFAAFEAALTEKTKAVIINSPNNPSGVVYTECEIKELCRILLSHNKKYRTTVYLISDEPYRELVFSGATVPYIMNYYRNSIVCYSYSKSLSLPGERIGYIAVNNETDDFESVYAAICGAGRVLGYVCAPSLFQRLIEKVYDKTADINIYRKNRDLLCGALREYGYTVIQPDGAFYLFVKSPEPDAKAFAERAKKYEILFVAGDDFGCEGYVRVCYCVSEDMIKRSLLAFKTLIDSYK